MPIWNSEVAVDHGYSEVTGRECGGCDLCCWLAAIPETDKPAHQRCAHQCGGCAIYDDPGRPLSCSEFACAWLRGYGEEVHRPDRCGVMMHVTSMNGGTWIFAFETREGAFEDAREMMVQIIRDIDLPMILINHGSRPPDDVGDATVIKDDLLPFTKRMRGSLLRMIANDIGIYELVGA